MEQEASSCPDSFDHRLSRFFILWFFEGEKNSFRRRNNKREMLFSRARSASTVAMEHHLQIPHGLCKNSSVGYCICILKNMLTAIL